MSKLNEQAYVSTNDTLVYDGFRLLDVVNKEVTITKGSAGSFKRGQVIDFDSATNTYKVHAASGVAACIVATETSYTTTDDKVVVPMYISGDLRASACISDPALTESDKENLRKSGIVLK